MNGSILYFITLSERAATFINSLIVFLYIQRENNAAEALHEYLVLQQTTHGSRILMLSACEEPEEMRRDWH